MKKDGEALPNATFCRLQKKCAFVTLVTIFMDLVRNEMERKAVKKTLTIPDWLNTMVEEKK